MAKEYPPILSGTPEQQLQVIRSYLVRMVDQIDQISNKIDSLSSFDFSADTENLVTREYLQEKLVQMKKKLREQGIDI